MLRVPCPPPPPNSIIYHQSAIKTMSIEALLLSRLNCQLNACKITGVSSPRRKASRAKQWPLSRSNHNLSSNPLSSFSLLIYIIIMITCNDWMKPVLRNQINVTFAHPNLLSVLQVLRCVKSCFRTTNRLEMKLYHNISKGNFWILT